MKWVIMFILVALIATAMQGQDSVTTIKGDITSTTFIALPDSIPVKITFAKHINDSTYYQVKIGKEKVNMVCCCKQKYFKGDVVMTAKKDLEFLPTKRRLFQ